MAHILVVEDDEGVQSYITESLARVGHHVEKASNGEEALALIESRTFDLVFSDLKMPVMPGMTLLKHVKMLRPDLSVVIITAHGTVDNAVDAMKLGADDFVQKPISNPEHLRELARKYAGLTRSARKLTHAHRSQAYELLNQTWRAPVMREALALLAKVAVTNAAVLLRGESGTGKEIAARALHALSPRAEHPMVIINCATLFGELLDSELFGHERGAFTGAQARRIGRIEQADGGTVFLDELGELPAETQAKLLRVIQQQTFERVGGNETIKVDVRWVAATNSDLHEMIEQGTFREDLYHRVAVFPLDIPPLRARLSDLDVLTQVILTDISAEFGVPALTLSEQASVRLQLHTWPGNIRELLNVLKRAAILTSSSTIDANDLIFDQPGLSITMTPVRPKTLADIEHAAIQDALYVHQGNRRQAAEALGIGLRTLYDKLKRHKENA